MKIAIVTDSTADLSEEFVEKYDIKVIPLIVNYGGKSYRDRVDLSNRDFYEYIKDVKTLPTTSQATPAEFAEIYKKCKEEGYDKIISIHISKEMSGTCRGAKVAADMVKDEIEVAVVDSRTVTLGLGLVVVNLAEYIQNNPQASWEEVQTWLRDFAKNTKILFLIDSLDNLQKGGRIGKASYLLGSVLNIKPILAVEDGFILAHEKVRGKKIEKVLDSLTEAALSMIDPDKKLYFGLGANSDAYFDLFEERIMPALEAHQHGGMEKMSKCEMGAVVTTHIGLGAVGIAFSQI